MVDEYLSRSERCLSKANTCVDYDDVDNNKMDTDNASCSSTEVSESDDMKRILTNILQTIAINDSSLLPWTFKRDNKDTVKTAKWLEYFQTFAKLRGLNQESQLHLFRLLMTDDAEDWLRSLPPTITVTIPLRITEFRKRFSVTEMDRWKKVSPLSTREQAPEETVITYFDSMTHRRS